jgi:hypothetical protein
MGLPAYFLGNQGVHDVMLLPCNQQSRILAKYARFELVIVRVSFVDPLNPSLPSYCPVDGQTDQEDTALSCGRFFLTDYSLFCIFNSSQSKFLLLVTTDDFAFKTGLFFSPVLFQELFVPRYKRLKTKATIPWVLHSTGNIEPVLETLIELGVVATHPNEIGAMDIRAIKKRYGDRHCVIGNVDLVLLGNGTPEQVGGEVRSLLRDLAPGGGYIISSGNSFASYLEPECVIAMSQAIQRYGE